MPESFTPYVLRILEESEAANGLRRYLHHCHKCRFLGHYKNFDLYWHDTGMGPIAQARWGNKYADYVAHDPAIPTFSLPILAAKQCARELGLYPK